MNRFSNFIGFRALLPRERRRISQREDYKGVTGDAAGIPRTQGIEARRRRRREFRKFMRLLNEHYMRQNPTGSKRVRRYAKVAGYVMDNGDGTGREPAAHEAFAWYGMLEERRILVGASLRTEEMLRLFLEDQAQFSKGVEPRTIDGAVA